MAINLNNVARDICKEERWKVNLSIAQVKEVIRCFIDVVSGYHLDEIIEMHRIHGGVGGLRTRHDRKKLRKFLNENRIR